MFRGFREFEEDPFFRDYHERFHNNFGMFDRPFGIGDPFAIEGPRGHYDRGGDRGQERRDDRRDLGYYDPFRGIFGGMNPMIQNMDRHFERAASNPNCYTYSQSSVMSYSNDGRGEPKYFQAHTTMKKAPGGIKETQKAVKDSESGIDRMAIGHHIGDRGHVVERSLNRRTNEEERKQDFINMEENDVHGFDSEWNNKTRSGMNNMRVGGDRSSHRALEEPARPRHDAGRHRHHHRDDRRHRPSDEGRRAHREEARGRDDDRRVRINSRPVNKHEPRGGLN